MSDPTMYGGYAQMPAEQPNGSVPRGPAPPPVLTAVKLMFAQAALGVLAVLAGFATKSSLRDQLSKNNPSFDASKLDSLVAVTLGITVVFGVVFLALYLLLALQVRKGKSWARIVTWVLAGLGAAFGLLSLAQPATALGRLISLVGVALDIAIIVLLAQRPSSAYFAART